MVFISAITAPDVLLSNGIKMPILGLGTSHFGGYSYESIIYALKDVGYRHIDTAKLYGCEQGVGEAVKESGIQRDQLFITTKVWPSDFGYKETLKAFETSLAKLDMDYVDLYLIHWPNPPASVKDKKLCLKETWLALEELYRLGKCKAIGVSNYMEEHLEDLFTYCSVKPHVNQIEVHPYRYEKSLIELCRKHDIVVAGYSPLVRMQFIENEKLRLPIEQIAKTHNRSIAQILIRWSVQHNVVTIPKSTKMERVAENINVFDFELTVDEMNVMDSLGDLASIKTCTGPVL